MSKYEGLSGKVAVITGAGGLLGMQHAAALAECDCTLALTDIEETPSIKSLIGRLGPEKSFFIKMDVTNESSIIQAEKDIRLRACGASILINNAALNPKVGPDSQSNSESLSRLEDFPPEQWERELSVGLKGTFLCSKIFGTKMADSTKGGVIVNISSDLSVIAPDQRLYSSSGTFSDTEPVKPITYSAIKFGIIGITKYIATYWAHKGVRCNALSPGGIYTNQPQDFVNRISNLIPMGRMAKESEYKGAIQFLCSDDSKYMNGQNLVMDGGRSAW